MRTGTGEQPLQAHGEEGEQGQVSSLYRHMEKKENRDRGAASTGTWRRWRTGTGEQPLHTDTWRRRRTGTGEQPLQIHREEGKQGQVSSLYRHMKKKENRDW